MPETPSIERIELGDGDWIEITHRPTHGRVNAWYQATRRELEDPSLYLELIQETIWACGVNWSVRGEDGHEIPWAHDSIGEAPFPLVMKAFRLCKPALDDIKAALDPND